MSRIVCSRSASEVASRSPIMRLCRILIHAHAGGVDHPTVAEGRLAAEVGVAVDTAEAVRDE